MQVPLQISFRNIDIPMGAEDRIRKHVEELEHYFSRIVGCHVIVERRHHRHHRGDLYHVRIDITLPRGHVVVSRDPPEHQAHRDWLVALHDAFDEARRQLEDQAREARAEVKTHEAPPHGRIVRLFPYEGYGFIASADGQEIYFQRESVTGEGFADLEVGDEVRFSSHPAEGQKGEQASSVTRIGKHHLPPAG
jgi:cold shock CspA family protein/ribosome-associated translation inhibitor RaiA